MILLFYKRVVNINNHGPPDCVVRNHGPHGPRAGGYFYSVPNNDLLSFSYDGSPFASSLEISVEDKIKRGKSPRIHLAVFLRGSRSSGRPSARSLLCYLHVLPLLRAIPAGCNTTLCRLQLKWLHILG